MLAPVALIFLLSTTCFAASIPANNTQKCPSIETNQQLQQLRIQCDQFENATVPQSVSPSVEEQLRCILYLANYNAACAKNVQLPASGIEKFNLANVCSNFNWIVEEAKSLIQNTLACQGLCVNREKGGLLDECNAAFYLDALTRAAAVLVDTKSTERNKNKLDEGVATAVLPKKPQEKVENAPKNADTNDIEHPAQPAAPPLSVDEDARAEHPPENREDQQSQQQVAVIKENDSPPAVPATSEKAAEKPVQTSKVGTQNSDKDKPIAAPSNNNAASGIQEKVEQQQQNEQQLHQEQQHQQQPPSVPQEQKPPQQKQEPQPPEEQNNHIDSPLNSDNANGVILNADNENPEEDIKLDDADDMDDDDDVDDQGELKYNKPNSDNDDSEKAPVNVPQKPDKTYSSPGVTNQNTVDSDSYFFSYFMMFCIIIVLFYVGYHNKQKIRAIVLEGPRGRRQYRSRRPNSANYHKLDSNLEEAITSSTANKGSSHVIY